MEALPIYNNDLKLREIRLLNIFDEQGTSDVSCGMHTVSLDTVPKFAALSYVWGPQTSQVPVQINGVRACIGRSLDVALRYFRKAAWKMPLWVDAICINQADLAERSAQVCFMDDIYSCATGIFVSLGPGIDLQCNQYYDKIRAMETARFTFYRQPTLADPLSQTSWDGGMLPAVCDSSASEATIDTDDETSLLFEFLQGACSLKINDHLSEVPRWGRRRLASSGDSAQLSSYPWTSLVKALQNFLDAEWWTRVWTIQESVVGKAPTFFYSDAAANWEMILEAVGSLQAHVSDCCTPYLRNEAPEGYANAVLGLIKQVQDIQSARDVYRGLRAAPTPDMEAIESFLGPGATMASGQPLGFNAELCFRMLLECLHTHRTRKATDPRDKIYSLLALVKPPSQSLFISPDYETRTEEAYIAAARTIVVGSLSLDILAVAGALPPSPTRLSLPSWCPDWSSTSTFYPESVSQIRALQWYDATPGMSPRILMPHEDAWRLEAKGVVVDTIGALGAVGNARDDKDLWKLLFEWSRVAPASTRWLDFCRTTRGDLWTRENHVSFYRMGGHNLRRDEAHERCWVDPVTRKLREDLPTPEFVGDVVTGEETKRVFREWDCVISTQAARAEWRGGGATPPPEEQLRTCTAQRRFMVSSSRGSLGLVPSAAQVGDAVAVFSGCRFPCVIRPVETTFSSSPTEEGVVYCVVGSAYVHRMMDGEVLNGIPNVASDSEWDYIKLR